MDFEELMEAVDKLRAKGFNDKDILNIFLKAFLDNELTAPDLKKAVNALGYEFSEEFENNLKESGLI